MPTFDESNGRLSVIPLRDFATERELQRLIEANLEVTYGCRLIASEFSTGLSHNGRIDTLAISEDGSPVIIEYKKVESAGLINQALFYLDWIKDHRGDFELAAQRALGNVDVDWSTIQVICIAPSYDNYSLHAVKHMGAGIELWRYRRYANGTLELEAVYKQPGTKRRSSATAEPESDAEVLPRPEYTIEEHLAKGTADTVDLFNLLNAAIEELDSSISVVPKKQYIAYKLARNLVCVEIQRKKVVVTLNRRAFENMPSNFNDVTDKGHWGTGDVEVHVSNEVELALAVQGIKDTYTLAGGD